MATLFGLSVVFTVLFCVAYFAIKIKDKTNPPTVFGLGASNVALGTTLGLALLLIGVGAIQWARKLMGDHEIVEMRHRGASPRTRTAPRPCRRWPRAPRSPGSPGDH